MAIYAKLKESKKSYFISMDPSNRRMIENHGDRFIVRPSENNDSYLRPVGPRIEGQFLTSRDIEEYFTFFPKWSAESAEYIVNLAVPRGQVAIDNQYLLGDGSVSDYKIKTSHPNMWRLYNSDNPDDYVMLNQSNLEKYFTLQEDSLKKALAKFDNYTPAPVEKEQEVVDTYVFEVNIKRTVRVKDAEVTEDNLDQFIAQLTKLVKGE
ncbi:hypothetical protein A54_57 [Septuagintavirus sv54]|uniref:Uncharacterized protein n=1 Tax=Escherichia phage A5-4 TaxID=2996162 RepID=A0AAE9PZP3_9CAUD|nr:hypothetical protein A54_57 [Escherichia phage A5-4]